MCPFCNEPKCIGDGCKGYNSVNTHDYMLPSVTHGIPTAPPLPSNMLPEIPSTNTNVNCGDVFKILRTSSQAKVLSQGWFTSPCASQWATKGQYLWFPSLGYVQVTDVEGDTIKYKNLTISEEVGSISANSPFVAMPPLSLDLLSLIFCSKNCDDEVTGDDYCFIVCENGTLKKLCCPPQVTEQGDDSTYGICVLINPPELYYIHSNPVYSVTISNPTKCKVSGFAELNITEFCGVSISSHFHHAYLAFIDGGSTNRVFASNYESVSSTLGFHPDLAAAAGGGSLVVQNFSAGELIVPFALDKKQSKLLELKFYSGYETAPIIDTNHQRIRSRIYMWNVNS